MADLLLECTSCSTAPLQTLPTVSHSAQIADDPCTGSGLRSPMAREGAAAQCGVRSAMKRLAVLTAFVLVSMSLRWPHRGRLLRRAGRLLPETGFPASQTSSSPSISAFVAAFASWATRSRDRSPLTASKSSSSSASSCRWWAGRPDEYPGPERHADDPGQPVRVPGPDPALIARAPRSARPTTHSRSCPS